MHNQISEGGKWEGIDGPNIAELSPASFMNKGFQSDEELYDLYAKYAKCIGFGVRKGDSTRDDDGNFVRRRFFCNKEGRREIKHYNRVDRKREHKPETRTGCKAMLSIYLDKSSSCWRVRNLVEDHNHELTPRRFVHLIPSHRQMTDADKAQIDSMQQYGILTTQIMGYMAGQSGGYRGLRFSKKDLYNYIDRRRRAKILDGDANAAINYLQGKADAEPMTRARYSYADGDRLGNLFWADGLSRVDYQYFSDVLAFDSTYKKNKYKRPLVIFSGSNHHKQTCIFGFALLADERTETYKWLLENFLDVMMGKQPGIVVTDGDEAMKEAIRVVFPQSTHRLCAWHLQKNATSKVKEPQFCEAFKKCMYANFDCDEFENFWKDVVQKFELQDNEWVDYVYNRKEMWAWAYLRDKFCAGLRTTSRCEGINSFIKRFINSRQSILELVQHLERAVREYRNNELVAQFNSINGKPVLTTGLDSIEHGAAEVYTREIFREVKQQIQGVMALNIVGFESIGTTVIYRLEKYGRPGHVHKVLYDRNSGRLECQCRLWNSHGIPCTHIFCVMKQEHIEKFPDNMILKRWTKDAKAFDEGSDIYEENNEKVTLLRYGSLCATSQWMSFLGSKSPMHFQKVMNGICKISKELEDECGVGHIPASSNLCPKVRDPAVAKTKGAPKVGKGVNKKRRCSNCGEMGHTKRTCHVGRSGKSKVTEDEMMSDSGSDSRRIGGTIQNTTESEASMMPSSIQHLDATQASGVRGIEHDVFNFR